MKQTRALRNKDAKLIAALTKKLAFQKAKPEFRNSIIKDLFSKKSTDITQTITKRILKEKSFNFRTIRKTVDVAKNISAPVVILQAADTTMWPMGTHCWIRDNSLIAARLLNSKFFDTRVRKQHHRLGKEMLLSCLTLMSTESQLKRFKNIITSKDPKYKNTPNNWPHIFLEIEGNLSAKKIESWSHIQDAWQILAYYTLRALKDGSTKFKDLKAWHIEFLTLVIPFIAKIDFTKQENSGSWEEVVAVRSSVIAWEFSLLNEFSQVKGELLKACQSKWEKFKPHQNSEFKKANYKTAVNKLIIAGAKKLAKNIPYEAPDYKKTHEKYREADSALIYLLMLNIPQKIQKVLKLKNSWAEKKELELLQTIETLYDPETGGYYRYENDLYQSCGFFRHETIAKLIKIYGAASGDASSNFGERAKIMPKGRKAAWTHFTWQLAAWSKNHKKAKSKHFKDLSNKFLLRAFRTITGDGEYTLEQRKELNVVLKKIPPFKFPECFISDFGPNKEELIFASPHTPLNWATAEAIAALSD